MHRKYLRLIWMMLAIGSFETQAQSIHVSPKGSDKNPGTKEKPVASLTAARSLARNHKKTKGLPKGGINVIIHGGIYDLQETFQLSEEDAGKKDAPIVWSAATGEKVNITGGKTINPGKFSRVINKNILNRLEKNAIGNVWQADLKAEGIKKLGNHRQYGHGLPVVPATLELFYNGEPMTLSRYPNKGAMKIGKVADPGSVPRTGDKSNRGALFAYTDIRHKKWIGQQNIWIQGTLNYGFADDYNPIDFIDTIAGQVKLRKPHIYGVASGKDFQEYVAINILEELDSPGEWYIDETSGILYFWPPADMKGALIQVSMLEDPIIALEGTEHVTLRGLTVEAGRGIGVYIERSNQTLVAGCTVRNVGTSGIFMGQGAKLLDENASIDDYVGEPQSRQIGSFQNHIYKNNTWNRNAGSNNGVLSCDVYNTGSGGIYISGGDKKTLTKGNSYAENCRVYNYTRRNKFTWAGIRVDGCGNRISHNEIFNSDWHGIFVHGNDHLFEYNYIHDVTLNSNDTSPWYIGRNPSDRGNVIRYNYLDNCGNPNRMTMGIYCDDSSTDVYVYGNVFNNMKTDHGVLFSNAGWNLMMKNNIVINPIAHTAVVSALWYTWAAPQTKEMFGKKGVIRKRLEQEIDFRSPPYSTRYPELLPYLDEIVEGKEWQGMRSRGNMLEGNLIVGGPENPIKLLGGQHAQMDGKNNWVTKEDPGFVDMKNKNFNLKPDAKVYKMIPGFEPIPFDKMGTYKDAYRK
ncbi:MAG: right-handed parallel beta-helix repeat-containing protein [bacterium]|jgi:hypothetical protein